MWWYLHSVQLFFFCNIEGPVPNKLSGKSRLLHSQFFLEMTCNLCRNTCPYMTLTQEALYYLVQLTFAFGGWIVITLEPSFLFSFLFVSFPFPFLSFSWTDKHSAACVWWHVRHTCILPPRAARWWCWFCSPSICCTLVAKFFIFVSALGELTGIKTSQIKFFSISLLCWYWCW